MPATGTFQYAHLCKNCLKSYEREVKWLKVTTVPAYTFDDVFLHTIDRVNAERNYSKKMRKERVGWMLECIYGRNTIDLALDEMREPVPPGQEIMCVDE